MTPEEREAARRREQTANGTETIMRATDLRYAERLHNRGWVLIPPAHVVEETPEAQRFTTPRTGAD